MNERLVRDLAAARENLRQKLKSLKADIVTAQMQSDIQYAPITEPLKEIIQKLDSTTFRKRPKKRGVESLEETGESMSELESGTDWQPIPGTSIIRRGTPSKRTRVSWFSPTTASSPTKTSPHKIRTAMESPSFVQPTFIEDEYIGEVLPETPKEASRSVDTGEDEDDTSGSVNLEKSMAHAITLLKTKPAKSIMANKSLNKTLLDAEVVKESLKNHDPLIRPYLMGFTTDEAEEFDHKYGIYESSEALKMGSRDVAFDGPNIVIGDFSYKGTKGLYELLFKKVPGKFTFADAKNYKFILKDTNAYRVRYDPEKKISANKGFKYTKIIKPILDGKPPNVWWTRNWKTGAGITSASQKQVLPNAEVEYKYWDDLNELCDRLRLLIASKQAGHTGHDNEIIGIIEELREAGAIQ